MAFFIFRQVLRGERVDAPTVDLTQAKRLLDVICYTVAHFWQLEFDI